MILFYPDKVKGYARIKLICDRAGISYTSDKRQPFKVVMRNDYRLKRYGGIELADYPWINDFCIDVTKSYTDKIFSKVFGYSSLEVEGEKRVLKKTEKQGTKDAEVVSNSVERESGYIYQRIINNVLEGFRIDFRVYIIGGEIVWIREKWKRSMIKPDIVRSRPAYKPFTGSQEEKILMFCREFGLDYGELDILKDYDTGQIYIVDVNDMPGVRKIEAKQPGYDEELQVLSDKFKEYYDNCATFKNSGSPCGVCFR